MASVEVHCFAPAPGNIMAQTSYSRATTRILSSNVDEDCGCGPTVFTGKPSNAARGDIEHRSAIRNLPIFKVDGTETSLDDIIGDAGNNPDRTSLVVFLRSLG
jgi:hypothetical protein